MEVWLTYSPEDFLLFSERVYWRMFALHNAAFWPAQIAAGLASVGLLGLLLRPRPWSGRAIAVILALAWGLVALGFLPRYATINWLAADLIPVFLIQSGLLILAGIFQGLQRAAASGQRWEALGLCLYGLFLHPMTPLLDGRTPAGGEVFALTPDPTAIVTLGVLAAAPARPWVWGLAVIPIAWCIASWGTLATLGAWQAWIPALCLLVFLVSRCRARTASGL